MKIHVRYFAVYADRLGKREENLSLPDRSTVGTLLDELVGEGKLKDEYLPSTLVAVNMEYVPRDHILSDGDDLALIPPVSGG